MDADIPEESPEAKAMKALASTIQMVSVREAATELMVRALFHTHPNQQLARTYAERMLGQTLAQPHFVLNPEAGKLLKSTVEFLMQPGPPEVKEAE